MELLVFSTFESQQKVYAQLQPHCFSAFSSKDAGQGLSFFGVCWEGHLYRGRENGHFISVLAYLRVDVHFGRWLPCELGYPFPPWTLHSQEQTRARSEHCLIFTYIHFWGDGFYTEVLGSGQTSSSHSPPPNTVRFISKTPQSQYWGAPSINPAAVNVICSAQEW